MPKTRFQMLLRGQNVVGYHNYPDDVVQAFVARAARRGRQQLGRGRRTKIAWAEKSHRGQGINSQAVSGVTSP
jgi:hypothetical protein